MDTKIKSGLNSSARRLQIDKANITVMTIVAIAAFISVASLVTAKAMLSQETYQARVIKEKQKARTQLQANIRAIQSLETAYQAFENTPQNLLGGSSSGSGDRDGDNAKLVLDALPSSYDFPALATSLEKILTDRKFNINGITGTDDELAQSKNVSSPDPKPVDMPFEIQVQGGYGSLQDLISVFEHSIRPFQFDTISLTGGEANMTMSLSGKTFYQPEKNLTITTKVVK